MAKIEDDVPNFDDVDLTDDMMSADEGLTPLEEPAAEAVPAATAEAPALTKAEKKAKEKADKLAKKQADAEAKADKKAQKQADAEKKAAKKANRPAAVDTDFEPEKGLPVMAIGIALGVLVVALALVYFQFLNLSTAVYIIGVAIIPLMIWAGRRTTTVYTVLLGCVLIALMTSVYWLWGVLVEYHIDVKAQEAKQRVTMMMPVDRSVQEAKPLV